MDGLKYERLDNNILRGSKNNLNYLRSKNITCSYYIT